ncbi:bifunctional adenosylcobinamide kinase/adenosylcobinamide-phosphate guanylyltransferase [Zongyangia hominis]|uniref:Adenosylcobinamide kinase n=1 Tax=Zongyangia hominis TaxID=2763677 RepID=A0A926IAK7_9FIRM|nr:bifunctional adenosylcobinamide kinase/adenosylcobinamide-phosphate guanylyltransferase [Zongyangia hominis]MBC8569298.1 bifunctional adenosylcobinamide kinase/adenosylcobinamide-phosphate guanylyltransferase [Zongyangia hominis]
MLTLIIGGAGSGKSAFAEALLAKSGCLDKIYIATMDPWGEEAKARIRRHRAMRRDKGFATVERFVSLSGLRVPKGAAVLLECVGNLAANELFSPGGAGKDAVAAIVGGVDALCARAGDVIVVANDVFSDGVEYDGETETYRRVMAEATAQISHRADRVAEVVCGIPIVHKGEF